MARFNQLLQPLPEPVAPHRHRPVDLVYLARQTAGNTGLERDVLRMFNQVSRTYFSRIETSTNLGELCRTLHSLKGAANGIGAWGIAELAGSLEDALAAGASVDPERIEDLNWAINEASVFIGHVLESERA